jgi:hypothetical protein
VRDIEIENVGEATEVLGSPIASAKLVMDSWETVKELAPL